MKTAAEYRAEGIFLPEEALRKMEAIEREVRVVEADIRAARAKWSKYRARTRVLRHCFLASEGCRCADRRQ